MNLKYVYIVYQFKKIYQNIILKKISVGIVGLGTIAQIQHLPNIVNLHNYFSIKSIADLSPKLCKQIAKNIPKTISIYSDWKNLCKDPRIEAVFFLTSGAHSLMSKYALLNNKHVFAEKPLSLTVKDAKELSSISKRKKLVLQVGYMKTYEPLIKDIKQKIKTLGELRSVRLNVYHPLGDSQLTHVNIKIFNDIDKKVLNFAKKFEINQTKFCLGRLSNKWGHYYREVLQRSVIHGPSLLHSIFNELPVLEDVRIWPIINIYPNSKEPPCLNIFGKYKPNAMFEMNWLFLKNYPKYKEILEIYGKKGSLEVNFPPPYSRKATAEYKLFNSKGISKKYGGNNSAFKIEIEEFYKNIINNNFDVNIREAIKDIAWLQKIVFLASQKYN